MDYKNYQLSLYEKIKYGALYMLLFSLIGKLFYDSFLMGAAGLFLFPLFLRQKKRSLAKKRQEKLMSAFKDLILSFSAGLRAGYSIENAFLEAYRDLRFIYEENDDILRECSQICNQMKNNQVLEKLLEDFGERSGQQDIKDFASVFVIAKRSGGNLSAIIQNTAHIISEKIEVKREIQVMFAARRMEQKIMNIIPFVIILYIRVTSVGYFDVLYGNAAGVIIMSVCLLVYAFAYFLSRRIMSIEI